MHCKSVDGESATKSPTLESVRKFITNFLCKESIHPTCRRWHDNGTEDGLSVNVVAGCVSLLLQSPLILSFHLEFSLIRVNVICYASFHSHIQHGRISSTAPSKETPPFGVAMTGKRAKLTRQLILSVSMM